MHLNSGNLYRAVTYKAIKHDALNDIGKLKRIAKNTKFNLTSSKLSLDGDVKDISSELRSSEVTKNVGIIAKIPEIRTALGIVQKSLAENAPKGVVVDGRDIGSEVLPNAQVKIYLTASPQVRAKRRAHDPGETHTESLEALQMHIEQRDKDDFTRQVGRLRIADGAAVIDSDDLTKQQVVDIIIQMVEDVRRI